MSGVMRAPEVTSREGPTCYHSGDEGKIRMVGMLMWEAIRRGDVKRDAAVEEEIKK